MANSWNIKVNGLTHGVQAILATPGANLHACFSDVKPRWGRWPRLLPPRGWGGAPGW